MSNPAPLDRSPADQSAVGAVGGRLERRLADHATFDARYLAAKKSVDDRSLNRHVWESLVRAVRPADPNGPLRVLEIGAGIGTMVERLVDWGLFAAGAARSSDRPLRATITAVEPDPENLAEAQRRLSGWALDRGFVVGCDASPSPRLLLTRSELQLDVRLEAADLYGFAERMLGRRTWDLAIAHAVLDLLDAPKAISACLALVRPDGLFYCTATFDGGTIFQPPVDPLVDRQVEALYHAAMDRQGSSQTGRHLFQQLRSCGAELLDAGSSDWVVFGGPSGYPADEAYFLHCILDLLDNTLRAHPELDSRRFEAWIAERRRQVERGELVYVAHQLDLLSRAPGPTVEQRARVSASNPAGW